MRETKSEEVLRREKEGVTSSGVKKTIWFHEDEAEALRLQAFKGRRSESSLIREAVRKLLKIEDWRFFCDGEAERGRALYAGL